MIPESGRQMQIAGTGGQDVVWRDAGFWMDGG